MPVPDIESIEPIEPMEPMEPIEPIEPIEPVDTVPGLTEPSAAKLNASLGDIKSACSFIFLFLTLRTYFVVFLGCKEFFINLETTNASII